MKLKNILLAVVIVLGSFTIAQAQTYVNGGVAGPHTTLGWNYGHLSYCVTYFDGAQNWYWAIVEEGGHGYTNNPGYAPFLAAACQTGNLAGVFVTKLSPLTWTQVITFPHN